MQVGLLGRWSSTRDDMIVKYILKARKRHTGNLGQYRGDNREE
jgi:hypothetical protein